MIKTHLRKDTRSKMVIFANYNKCPACGYWAFNGYECFDCGYRCGAFKWMN